MKWAMTFCITIVFGATWVLAQDITKENMHWEVSELKDLQSGESMAYQCSFNTYGSKSIKWIQRGNYTEELEVKKVKGKWKNVNEDGKMVYHVIAEGDEGTITFERDKSGIRITLDLAKLQYNFRVSDRKRIQ